MMTLTWTPHGGIYMDSFIISLYGTFMMAFTWTLRDLIGWVLHDNVCMDYSRRDLNGLFMMTFKRTLCDGIDIDY
jgi:hypothetical protein